MGDILSLLAGGFATAATPVNQAMRATTGPGGPKPGCTSMTIRTESANSSSRTGP